MIELGYYGDPDSDLFPLAIGNLEVGNRPAFLVVTPQGSLEVQRLPSSSEARVVGKLEPGTDPERLRRWILVEWTALGDFADTLYQLDLEEEDDDDGALTQLRQTASLEQSRFVLALSYAWADGELAPTSPEQRTRPRQPTA